MFVFFFFLSFPFLFWKSRGQYASIPGICKKTLPSPFHPLLTPRDLRSSPPALLPSLPGPPHFHLHQFTLYTLLLPPLLPSHHTSTIAPSTPRLHFLNFCPPTITPLPPSLFSTHNILSRSQLYLYRSAFSFTSSPNMTLFLANSPRIGKLWACGQICKFSGFWLLGGFVSRFLGTANN